MLTTVYDFTVRTISGEDMPLSIYRGKVLLIVNVASKCGFTPQYKGLEHLHRKYGPNGFSVLGFPCNQFGGQEPGTNAEINEFCTVNYGITFPMFDKIEVNGENTHPLYKHLKSSAPGVMGSDSIKWNFTKFLVNKEGRVADRFASSTTPESLNDAIEKLLGLK